MSALSRTTDSRFICTASRPTSIASSTNFLAIFCTPSRNSFEVRDSEGLRSRASSTPEKSLSSESIVIPSSPNPPIMARTALRSVTTRRHPQSSCAIPVNSCEQVVALGGQRREQRPPVDPADQRVDQVLRVRHQAEHVEPAVEHAGDVMLGSVGIGGLVDPPGGVAVAEGDLSRALDRLESRVVGLEIPLAVGDGELDHLTFGVAAGEWRRRVLDAEVLHL